MTFPHPLRSLLRTTVIAGAVYVSLLPVARAADFTFLGPTNITGDSDISTFGNLVQAYNFNNAGQSPVINGVTFNTFDIVGTQASVTVGTTTLSTPSDSFYVFPGYGSPNAPFSNLSADYQTLLSSAPVQFSGDTPEGKITLSLTGLTIGQQYLFQTFANQSLDGTQGRFCFVRGGANYSTVGYNTGTGDGGVGQYLTATFTADATTQDVIYTSIPGSGGETIVSGFQLRAAPEPSSMVCLALLGAVGGYVLRRRLAY